MNPLNLTNEDFGAIEIYKSTYRRDPQQRSREFFRQFKLTQIATILPNETYVSFSSVVFLRLRAWNSGPEFVSEVLSKVADVKSKVTAV